MPGREVALFLLFAASGSVRDEEAALSREKEQHCCQQAELVRLSKGRPKPACGAHYPRPETQTASRNPSSERAGLP